MPRHLFLPKQSLKDVRTLLRLDDDKLRALEELLGTGESISPHAPTFVEKVSERLRLDVDSATSVALVGQFLLTVVEEGHPPDEIIDDVRHFVEQHAEDKSLLTSVDAKRKLLVSMLTPKPERARALKIRYLQSIYPTATSFRSICELRPVFDPKKDGEEEIIGYVPTVLLQVKQSDAEGDESQIVLNLSPASLKSLTQVLLRADKKLTAIRRRLGEQLLGDTAQE